MKAMNDGEVIQSKVIKAAKLDPAHEVFMEVMAKVVNMKDWSTQFSPGAGGFDCALVYSHVRHKAISIGLVPWEQDKTLTRAVCLKRKRDDIKRLWDVLLGVDELRAFCQGFLDNPRTPAPPEGSRPH